LKLPNGNSKEVKKVIPNIEYIKILLLKNGWSQNQFALKAQLTPATISRLLSGKRQGSPKTIQALMKTFPKEPINKLFILS
jgi:transcriptional regulator with XRE-family HTH domain